MTNDDEKTIKIPCNFTLNSLLNEIELELAYKHLVSALFLSLAVPDICCGKNTPKECYVQWFDTWVVCDDPKPIINGVDCYNLRCAILHSGTPEEGFSLSCDSCNEFHIGHIISIITNNSDGIEHRTIRVNINELTENILAGAKDFIQQKGDMELFNLTDYGKITDCRQ